MHPCLTSEDEHTDEEILTSEDDTETDDTLDEMDVEFLVDMAAEALEEARSLLADLRAYLSPTQHSSLSKVAASLTSLLEQ